MIEDSGAQTGLVDSEKHVPLHMRNIIVAESGASDGLGFPFLYIGLYLVLMHEPSHPVHTVGQSLVNGELSVVCGSGWN
jgi:NhaP-type Na+/H+ or K+/H+ antiporter